MQIQKSVLNLKKFMLWKNKQNIRSKVGKVLHKQLQKSLEFRPKDFKDYYRIGRWMVSRRLAWVFVLAAGCVSILYLAMIKPVRLFGEKDVYPTYRYNAIPLKFHKGQVKILGKSGYTAYIGEVKKGRAEGRGTLYNREGDIVYQGEFAANQYQGQGELNYAGNLLRYQGEFQKNLFHGAGSLYRKNGNLEYQGTFYQGKKQGQGTLYGDTETAVYQGKFQADEIVYEELLGKTTTQASEMYTGSRKIFSLEDEICAALLDIEAVYCGKAKEALKEEWTITGVYVLKDYFRIGGQKITKISELTDCFGEPAYEGYTEVSFSEAVALNQLANVTDCFGAAVEMTGSKVFSDVEQIQSYDDTYSLYLTAYTDETCQYLFFSDKRREEFFFYLMEELSSDKPVLIEKGDIWGRDQSE